VTGAFMKCFGKEIGGCAPCWIEDRRDALRVAAKLGIKLLTFDFEKEYQRRVLGYFYRQYQAGRTPNPDVICNKYIKIPLLLKEAKKMGFDYVATGHYARIKNGEKVWRTLGGQPRMADWKNKLGYKLCQALDKNKDQTYFLHQLKERQLQDILFPLGTVYKNEVRLLARQWGLPVAGKEESMGICFVGEVPMKEFLKNKIKTKPGDIVMSAGASGNKPVKVGRHEGLAFYTIGERIGEELVQRGNFFKKGETKPFYAVKKDTKNNLLVAGFENDPLLYKKKITIGAYGNTPVYWIGQKPVFPLKCEVRLRHRQPLQQARLERRGQKITMKFLEPQRAPTPGQFAVFYKDGECLGGGVIGN
ncbi:MAG: tRNA 2-thiouridine(34) synthase MnmA, partial [Candidatus Magasanikbacteria bacterium]|nr:tRNA 2-thiouridine(34) synthase MnmA [Candidatus Magasanikbacteria bacterium]